MGKEPKRPVLGAAWAGCLLIAVSLCIALLVLANAPFLSWRNQIPNWRGASDAGEVGEATGEGDTLKDLLRRLVRGYIFSICISVLTKKTSNGVKQQFQKQRTAYSTSACLTICPSLAYGTLRSHPDAGEERYQLEVGGFTCHFDLDAEMCLSAKPVRISNGGLTVHVPSDGTGFTRLVRPYSRIGDELAMKLTTPVQILHGDMANLPACNFTHSIPAVIFSTGVTGNAYHEFSEIIIPLFLTCQHFRSQLKFVATDYNEWWIQKYSRVLNRLSDYEAVDLSNGGVHCFPGAVVGLRYHGNLALNASDVPGGHSMREFRQFLRESYNLKTKNVHEIDKLRKPVLILISRTNSRKILNEDTIVELAQELGFQVVTAGPSMMSNLELFAKMVGSCSVFIGVHGAGLTNEIFLPDGAVVIQVVLLGLEWGSTNYYGTPATAMGLQYLEYKIEPQESSLSEVYGPDHPVVVDPLSVFAKGYMAVRAVYVDGQNVKINSDRFKATLEEAMRLVGHSTA